MFLHRTAEFFLNLTFFFIYPFGMVHLSCKKPEYSDQPTNSDQSNVIEIYFIKPCLFFVHDEFSI